MSNMIHNFPMRDQHSSPALDWQVVGCCLVSKVDVYSGHVKPRKSAGIIKKGGKR